MKNFLVAIMILCGCGLYAQDAGGIINASRNRINADTISTQSKMIITAKNGNTTERSINQYSKDDANGKNRMIIEFLAPASVRGTRFLTMENKTGVDDRFIYLPELNKVRRIAASEGSGSFMGTDMSYDDIASTDREVDKDTHKVLREEAFGKNVPSREAFDKNAPSAGAGKMCYVIESKPKDASYQYNKMISWIDKNNSVTYRLELYDKKDNLQKVFETLELKDVQGRLSPWVTKMTTLKDGTFTTIYIQKLAYDSNIPEGAFTTNYLETGRTK
ncbi:hypothetical protein FACS1894102_3720 [Spirochaetia bacterium]|nr:hypothetical protein FACS1894102_3720 [Spirochaetia bacterium]